MTAAWLYLIASAIGALFTLQALRPIRLPNRLAIPSFFMGWLTNELVLHHLVWQTLTSAGFIALGALDTWPGWIAVALTLLQWAGNAIIIRRVFAARPVLEAALTEVTGVPAHLDPGTSGSHGVTTSQLVMPFPPRHPRVERTRGITFARAGGRDLQLDVYRRDDHPTGAPIVLYLHGGAWVISNRNEQGLPVMHEFAARGWVGVNADYRLAPFASMPDLLVDVKRAIAWVREHAHEWGGDPDFILATGGSAGGHLTALAALTANDPQYQPGFEDADTSIQAAVPFYGIYGFREKDLHDGHADFVDFMSRWVFKASPDDDPDLWAAMEPREQIGPDAPPMLVIHGEKDTLASARGARDFVDRLREVSKVPVGYAELPGTQHAFEVFPSLRTAYVLETMARFAEHVRGRSATPPSVTEPGASLGSSVTR